MMFEPTAAEGRLYSRQTAADITSVSMATPGEA